ncbi:MAG: DUF748 domain-containing protein, partial [Verrucomicrobia bacterium]|nr:DUF748 domain-containing protein [Verrucomicrobiota bacterium]
EVRVVQPYAHFQINPDYSFNISDILQRFDGDSEAAAPDEEAGLPTLRVERMTISNAVVQVSDLTLREPFHRKIGPVNLILKKFYTHPENENPYSFAGSTEAGERFAWTGRFFLFPLRSEGEVSIENVHIPGYAPFYQDFLSLTIADGVIDLSGSYRLEYSSTNNLLSVSNGAFHLASLKVSDDPDAAENALQVDDLKVSGVEADLWQRTVRVGAIAVNGGSLLVRRNPDASINLVEMAKPSETNAVPAGTILHALKTVTNLISTFLATTNHAVAVVESLEVDDWALQVEDDINPRPVRLHLDDITVRGRNLSNIPGKDLSLGVACRWNTNGTVKVDVDARLFPIHSDVRIKIDRIALPPLDPYVEPFARVLLLDSKFSLDGVARIRRDAMAAPFDAQFEGGLSLDDFSSVEGLMGTDLVAWKSLQVSGIQARLDPMGVNIGRIAIYDAKARVVVETNRTINLLNAMNVGDSNAPATVPMPGKSRDSGNALAVEPKAGPVGATAGLDLPPITVSSVVISNAALDVVDLSTEPALSWRVTGVNGEIGGLSSTNLQRADLKMTARAGGTSCAKVASAWISNTMSRGTSWIPRT